MKVDANCSTFNKFDGIVDTKESDDEEFNPLQLSYTNQVSNTTREKVVSQCQLFLDILDKIPIE